MPNVVIDTSIAQAAGEKSESENAQSYRCRMTLMAIRDSKLHVDMSPDLLQEWKSHRSNLTSTWLTSMHGRKRVDWLVINDNCNLSGRVPATLSTPNEKKAVLEDMHLILCAFSSGKRVLSLDEAVRGLLRVAARSIRELEDIMWANPCLEGDAVEGWISAEAPRQAVRELGFSEVL